MRGFLKVFLALAVAGAIAYFQETHRDRVHEEPVATRAIAPPPTTASARQFWGNPSSLPDHFARHGADFGARSPEEYAQMAAQFLRRAKAEGLPAKIDSSGVLRVYDDQTDTFAAYNRDGTAKTFFKPGSRDYFARQPGMRANLRTWR